MAAKVLKEGASSIPTSRGDTRCDLCYNHHNNIRYSLNTRDLPMYDGLQKCVQSSLEKRTWNREITRSLAENVLMTEQYRGMWRPLLLWPCHLEGRGVLCCYGRVISRDAASFSVMAVSSRGTWRPLLLWPCHLEGCVFLCCYGRVISRDVASFAVMAVSSRGAVLPSEI